MSYAYPIYNLVTRYEGGPAQNFGAREGFTQKIQVGTSAKNSHNLAVITVEKNTDADGRVNFSLWLDGECVKRGTLKGKEYTPLRIES